MVLSNFTNNYLLLLSCKQVVGVMFNCCEPESISKALKEIRTNPQVHHHLQHPPEQSSSLMPLKDEEPPKIFLGAYANRLTPVEPGWTMDSSDEAQPMRDDLPPENYWQDFVKKWHSSSAGSKSVRKGVSEKIGGVQLIGGCCGIGPGHISVLKERLAAET